MESIEQMYRKRRIFLGLTQEQAASAARVSRRTLSNFENGNTAINLMALRRLLHHVGLELSVREASTRPTLDELSTSYEGNDIARPRKRAHTKKK